MSENEARAAELIRQVASELVDAAPAGWTSLDAVFALTVSAETSRADYLLDGQQLRIPAPGGAMAAARAHREVSEQLEDGVWWRLRVRVTAADNQGERSDGGSAPSLQVDYDYGDTPFPDDQMLPPEAYLADLERYPRGPLPGWLAAYLHHDGRQHRTATMAANQSWSDRIAQVRPTVSDDQLPALHAVWARWAVLSAGFVAQGSAWGPRILPSLGWFESAKRSGATLYLLPGGRAVLSGGVWDAPELDAVYNEGGDMPAYYAGAPSWVTNEVLNLRASTGRLTFCYWWERGHWYRGESPGAEAFAMAMPSIWSGERVAEKTAALVGGDRAAASALVAAAEAGVATRETVSNLFGDSSFDVDGAFHQLALAGVVASMPDELDRDQAIALVSDYITVNGIDTTNYPLEELVADRLSVGWIVYVPVPKGQIMMGRALFYVADDGVVERSSSSTAPSVYEQGFAQRFRQRVG